MIRSFSSLERVFELFDLVAKYLGRPRIDVIRALPAASLFNHDWDQTSCGGLLLAALLVGRSPSGDLRVLEAKSEMGRGC